MPSFAYVARDTASGREIRSVVEAGTEQAAMAALLNRNLLVVSIQEKLGKKGKTAGGKVSLEDLVVFTRQLATMIDAGLAMVQSLQALAEQTPNKVMRDVIKDVCARVECGDSFSEALAEASEGFHPALRRDGVRRGEGRFAGGNSGAPGHLPGEHRPAAEEGEVGDDVSDRGHGRRHCHHDLPAGEGGPGVRGNLLGVWGQAARAHACS